MLISSISPSKQAIHTLRSPAINDSQESQNALKLDSLIKPSVDELLVNNRFAKPAVAEVSVRNVDARSMIPA